MLMGMRSKTDLLFGEATDELLAASFRTSLSALKVVISTSCCLSVKYLLELKVNKYLWEGSLRSPPARPGQFFEIINHSLSDWSLKNRTAGGKFIFRTALCSKKTHFRALRARGAREPKQVHTLIICTPRQFQWPIARPHRYTWYPNRHYNTPIII